MLNVWDKQGEGKRGRDKKQYPTYHNFVSIYVHVINMCSKKTSPGEDSIEEDRKDEGVGDTRGALLHCK